MPGILIDISTNIAKLQQGMADAQTSINGFAKSWQVMATGVNQATQLFQQVANAAQAPIKAYMESETALLKMGMALKNQGDFSRAALKDMQDFAEHIQKVTSYEDDFTLAVMGNLKSFGMSNAEVKNATRVALDYATAKANEGITVEKASEILGKAYLGQTTGLKRLGIQVSETATAGEVFDSVMKQLEQRFGGSAQASLVTYAGQWKQLQNQWGDIQEVLGLGLLKTLQGVNVAAGLIGITFLTAGQTVLETINFVMTPLNLMLKGMAGIADFAGMTGTADALRAIATATDEAAGSIKGAKEGVMAWTAKQQEAMLATDNVTKAIDKMGIAGQRTVAIDEKAAAARKKAAEEYEKLLDKRYADEMKILLAVAKAEEDMRDDGVHWAKVSTDKILRIEHEAADKIIRENEKATREAIDGMEQQIEMGVKLTMDSIERAKKRGEAEREIYKDLRGYADQYFSAAVGLIESQAQKYRELGVDEVAVAQWVTQELEKEEIKRLKASDGFFDGVKGGLLEITTAHTTWGTTAYNLTKQFSTDAAKAFGSNFKDIVKGDFSNLEAAWSTVWDNMLTKLGESIGDMIVEAAANDILMMFKGSWTSDSSSILGIINKGWDLWNAIGTGGGGGTAGGGTSGTEFADFAAEGGPIGGKPVWVGERGPELLFPRGPGYVMEHNQSMAYAAKNGGYIPGFADGGMVTPQYIYSSAYDLARSLGYRPPAVPPNLETFQALMDWANVYLTKGASSPAFSSTTESGNAVDQFGAPINLRYNDILGYEQLSENMRRVHYEDGTIQDMDMSTINKGFWSTGEWIKYLAIAIMSYATGGAAGYVGGGLAGAGIGAGMGGMSGLIYSSGDWNAALKGAIGGGVGGYSATAGGVTSLLDAAKSIGTDLAKKYALGLAFNYIGNAINGGEGGAGSISFEGISGDLSWLADSMGKIAPSSTQFGFQARNGLDYVPYDGFGITAHRGEAVLNARDAAEWRGGADSGELVAEIRALRGELRKIASYAGKQLGYTEQWDTVGTPPVRT